LSSDYAPAPGFFDELFDSPGRPRAPAAGLAATLGRLGRDRLRSAGERRDAIFLQQGITFDASGPDGGPSRDRPFPLDLIPRVLPAGEWRTIKRGLAQRVRALNLFVADVYHEHLFAAPDDGGADPTNRRLAGEEHVKIGHGRFYGDVPPIKGVYRGTATAEHEVAVTMTRL
jgi:hypothetical protein